MQLDTLYKQGKTAIQVCNIYVEHDTVIVEFGQLNGRCNLSLQFALQRT